MIYSAFIDENVIATNELFSPEKIRQYYNSGTVRISFVRRVLGELMFPFCQRKTVACQTFILPEASF